MNESSSTTTLTSLNSRTSTSRVGCKFKPIRFKCNSTFASVFPSRTTCTESMLSLKSSEASPVSATLNADVNIIFSNFQSDNNFLYSPDSPLLPKVPTRKVRKTIDKSPSSYLPLSTIQRTVNGDNAKNVLKQR